MTKYIVSIIKVSYCTENVHHSGSRVCYLYSEITVAYCVLQGPVILCVQSVADFVDSFSCKY